MAKAKKSDSPVTPAGVKKKAAKPKPPVGSSAPMIDTGLAAESAAKRVAAGMSPATPSTACTGPVRESASFKNLKDSFNKPASAGLANILDKTAGPGQKKTNLPFHASKQVGRNQTFGADVNRTGVPRRTGGG